MTREMSEPTPLDAVADEEPNAPVILPDDQAATPAQIVADLEHRGLDGLAVRLEYAVQTDLPPGAQAAYALLVLAERRASQNPLTSDIAAGIAYVLCRLRGLV